MEASHSASRDCLLRPAVSPDGRYLAVIKPSLQLHVLELDGLNGCATLAHASNFSPRHKTFLQEVSHLAWAPEVVHHTNADGHAASSTPTNTVQTWLLLANSNRVVVLEIGLKPGNFVELNAQKTKESITADYEYPDYYGKLTAIDFVFNHTCAIVLFDIFDCACIQHFEEAQRDDIPARKFATKRGYATARGGKYLAILLRERQKDRLAILDNANLIACFDVGTVDAAGFQWSPDGLPYLGIWDTSSSSTNIKFYSATGQYMSALEVDARAFPPQAELTEVSGLGVSALSWIPLRGSDDYAIMALGDGSGQVLHRVLKPRSLAVTSARCVKHRGSLDPSKTTIWHEIGMGEFRQEEGLWTLSDESNSDVDFIALNPGGSLFATKISKDPNVVFIWASGCDHPLTAIIFQHRVRQALWHPAITTALVVLTAREGSFVNLWYDRGRSPVQGKVVHGSLGSTVGWEAQWIVQHAAQPSDEFFIISNSHAFELGHLGVQGAELVFRSLRDDTISYEEVDSPVYDTPSRPSKRDQSGGGHLGARGRDTCWLSSR